MDEHKRATLMQGVNLRTRKKRWATPHSAKEPTDPEWFVQNRKRERMMLVSETY
jgi:hypothetical protein